MAKDKDKDPNKAPSSTLEKMVMGAIIGTAIGSALGMSLAPQKGVDTREFLKSKTKDATEVGKLGKETAVGFFKVAKRLLFGKTEKPFEGMKEIPTESEIIPPKHVDRD